MERPQGALASPRGTAAGLPAEPIDLAMKLTVLLDKGRKSSGRGRPGLARGADAILGCVESPMKSLHHRSAPGRAGAGLSFSPLLLPWTSSRVVSGSKGQLCHSSQDHALDDRVTNCAI
jgi:hypothetical protein